MLCNLDNTFCKIFVLGFILSSIEINFNPLASYIFSTVYLNTIRYKNVLRETLTIQFSKITVQSELVLN